MRETLSYTAVIGGQEVTVTRHQPSNGKGLTQRIMKGETPIHTKRPVDNQLHALDMLLESAKEHDSDYVIQEIEKSIGKRVQELTRG